jgi:hypothetical protein
MPYVCAFSRGSGNKFRPVMVSPLPPAEVDCNAARRRR